MTSRAAVWAAKSGGLRSEVLPTSSRLCVRMVAGGSSTPLFRTRQEAYARPALVPLPRPDFRTSPAVEDTSAAQLESAFSATEIVARARAAAERGDKVECHALIWALKDLPRGASVREAIDAPSGEKARTLLHVLVAARHGDATEVLLELGPKIGSKDEDGRTALHIAAAVNSPGLAKLLLRLGRAPVNARDCDGRTPLHVASEAGHALICRTLMRCGANANGVDGQGNTPLDVDKRTKIGENTPLDVGRREKGWRSKKNRIKMSALIGKYHKASIKTIADVKDFARDMGPSPKANGHYKKGALPHIVAPKLVLTPTGYCPVDDITGKVRPMPRGIRMAKARQMPSDPKCHVNWYSPRG